MARIVEYALTYLVRPHVVLKTAYGAEKQEKDHVLVKLTDENGCVGYGESTPLSRFTGETARVVFTVLEEVLLPRLKGVDSGDVAAAHEIMDKAIADNCAAKSAVDCAMYDLTAKALGVPLYTLLGGRCRERVPINRHMGIMEREEAIHLTRLYREKGYDSIKMKVGDDVDRAADRIRGVREAAGEDVKIRVDANCGYTYHQAQRLIRQTEDCRLEYYEQLLPKWDLEGMRALRRECGAPLLADEAVNSVRDAVRWVDSGAVDGITIKLCKCGGLYPALRIAGVAAAGGVQAVVASTYDTHVGCSACLHLATALPNASSGCDLTTFATQPGWAETCHRLEGMFLQAGAAPGIGVSSMTDYPMETEAGEY